MQPFEKSDPARNPQLRDPCELRRNGGAIAFTAAEEAAIERLIEQYPTRRAAVLPLLWMIQEKAGWIPQEAIGIVADRCGVAPSHVYGVVSFYTMYKRAPMGKYSLQVCTNLSCQLMGAQHVLDCLKRRLGIGPGETTPDGMFSLEEVECLAACEMAPVIQVSGEEYVGPIDEKGVDALLARLRAGEPGREREREREGGR